MRRLREELENLGDKEHPPAWRPEVGDILIFRFLRYERATTRNDPQSLAIGQDEDTSRLIAIWLGPVVLRDALKDLRPNPGERIGIRRLPDGERGYRRFVVRVDRDGSDEPDFFKEDPQDPCRSRADAESMTDDEIPF